MSFKFDPNLEFQLDAIKSVTGLFDGVDVTQIGERQRVDGRGMELLPDSFVGNYLNTDNEVLLLQNLQKVQADNRIVRSLSLIAPDDPYRGTPAFLYPFANYSVEMETGTGKTYVYLRTIFELHKHYGLKKFIIVVPSVAIREGVIGSIADMTEHFKMLYNNVPFTSFVYSSKDVKDVQKFAIGSQLHIMIINIQAFQRDAGEDVEYDHLSEEAKLKLAIIHREQDQFDGGRPIEAIQMVRPVVIIDEPQSVDTTAKSQQAIRTLRPLFCLRYSATHTNPYNLIYQLDPVRAYEMRLVKRIVVSDMAETLDANQLFIRVEKIGYLTPTAKVPQAKITLLEDTANGVKEKTVTVKLNSALRDATNRADYTQYVSNIHFEEGNSFIEFSDGLSLGVGAESGGFTDEKMKTQMQLAIDAHFAKEKQLKGTGIKVLSLFFIDHVKSYRTYDADGNRRDEKLVHWFEELYDAANKRYGMPSTYRASEVHRGYFSCDKRKGKVVDLLDTNGTTARDDETYHLIMQGKATLLKESEPVRFIFSHSALKEGWDNPNVFQICSLREMGSEPERRQTVGRGLRLPLNQEYERIVDERINQLTVIASETFESFANGLQRDIERVMGKDFKFGRIHQAAFVELLNPQGTAYLTTQESVQIWKLFKDQGLVDEQGALTKKYLDNPSECKVDIPDDYAPIAPFIYDRVLKFVPKTFAVNARDKRTLKYNKRIELNEDFKKLWNKISQKTRYRVEFKTVDLITKAVEKIVDLDDIRPVSFVVTTRRADITTEQGVTGGNLINTRTVNAAIPHEIPDLLTVLQEKTELTRSTLFAILKQVRVRSPSKMDQFIGNPHAFITAVSKAINAAMSELVIDGIKYEPIRGEYYEMRLFENPEIERYLSQLYQVTNKDKTPYDYVIYESDGVEKRVAEGLDNDARVKFYCKLPDWFKVDTPLDAYRPDWAVVVEEDHGEKLYLVRETKSTHDSEKRRDSENKKIKCGKAHFAALGVDFSTAINIAEVLTPRLKA
jgi:type III restriction enzyme